METAQPEHTVIPSHISVKVGISNGRVGAIDLSLSFTVLMCLSIYRCSFFELFPPSILYMSELYNPLILYLFLSLVCLYYLFYRGHNSFFPMPVMSSALLRWILRDVVMNMGF